jgi:hypothetical protein
MSEDEFVSIKPTFGRKATKPKEPNDSHVESKDAYNEKPPVRRRPQVVDPDATEESEVDFNKKPANKGDKKTEKVDKGDKKKSKDGGSEKPETPADESFFSQNKTIIVIIVFVIILVIVVIWIFVKDPKKNPFKSAEEGDPRLMNQDPRMIGPPQGPQGPQNQGPQGMDPRDPRRRMLNAPPQNPQQPPNMIPVPPPVNQANQPSQVNQPNQPNHNELVQSSDADEEAIRYMQRKKMMHDEQKKRGKIEVIESDDENSEEKEKPAKSTKKTKKTSKKPVTKKTSPKNSKKTDDDIEDEDLDNLTMHSDDEATDAEAVNDLEELEFSDEETPPKKTPVKRGRKPTKSKK